MPFDAYSWQTLTKDGGGEWGFSPKKMADIICELFLSYKKLLEELQAPAKLEEDTTFKSKK